MPKFTLGKWYVTDAAPMPGHRSVRIRTRATKERPYGVFVTNAILDNRCITAEERNANARLIAAAPEMYDTLLLAMGALRDGHEYARKLADDIEALLARIDGKEEDA